MSPQAGGYVSLLGLDPAVYESHALHASERTYVQTNCYTDIIIELLHARGLQPLAAMGMAARMDFEGDQWTFLKPAPADLELLYGLDIHEMQPYRPLPEQASEQIAAGRTIIVELDSWYLPDTAATSYRNEHVKSSVVVESIDERNERMRYFHAAGLYELAGEDYRGVFRLGRELSDDVLPPYTELVRFDVTPPLSGGELAATARRLLAGHLAQRPATNPFVRFEEGLQRDLPRLLAGDAADYHAYAFATVRMAGSAFEALASEIEWLLAADGAAAAQALLRIVQTCKTLSFRLARRKPFDPSETLAALREAWEEAMVRLEDALA
jgi:hypothetical protein